MRARPDLTGFLLFAAVTVVGVVAIALGWKVAAGESVLAKQVPAVVSGGIAGVALVFVAGSFLSLQVERRAAQERRRQQRRLLVELRAVVELSERTPR